MKAVWEELSDSGGGAFINFGDFRINVHRHIDYPNDVWIMTVDNMLRPYAKHVLKAKELGEAKSEAMHYVFTALTQAASKIAEAWTPRVPPKPATEKK